MGSSGGRSSKTSTVISTANTPSENALSRSGVLLTCVTAFPFLRRDRFDGPTELSAAAVILAVGTGLLTCDTVAQAEARSGQDGHNKGAEAAAAALLQINAARTLGAV